jgi:hypothetical protein
VGQDHKMTCFHRLVGLSQFADFNPQKWLKLETLKLAMGGGGVAGAGVDYSLDSLCRN